MCSVLSGRARTQARASQTDLGTVRTAARSSPYRVSGGTTLGCEDSRLCGFRHAAPQKGIGANQRADRWRLDASMGAVCYRDTLVETHASLSTILLITDQQVFGPFGPTCARSDCYERASYSFCAPFFLRSAHRFFINMDNRFLPAALMPPRLFFFAGPFRETLTLLFPGRVEPRPVKAAMAREILSA